MKRQITVIAQLITDLCLSLRTTPNMMVNGFLERTSGKVKEDKSGQMDQCTRVGGRTTKPTAREDSSMLTETYMTDNGSMIKPMGSVFIAILMEPNMKVIGKKINNMETVWKHGQMVPNTKANTYKERNTELADLPGLMAALITVNLLRIISKAKENIIGLMEENMMVHG